LNHSTNGSDERLLIEAAQNDPSRFAELYESHFGRVYAFVARRVRNRTQAQELTSEVFHHALANLQRFEWRGAPFASWLYRIASNAITDHSRRLQRERDYREAADPPERTEEADIEDSERQAHLFQLVYRLPADQRDVVLLRFAEEKSIREIAEQLGRTEGAVKQLQFRGLKTLRAIVSKTHG
jgi:RNA polymerase sigma-70 factor (ECF subfamily)